MSKLLILTILFSLNAFGSTTPKKAVKEPAKALKSASARLSSTYVKGYPSSQIVLRIQPKVLKEGKKMIGTQCKQYTLDCAIFPDSQEPNTLLNVSVQGTSANIKKLLTWIKNNSSKYSESQHQKK